MEISTYHFELLLGTKPYASSLSVYTISSSPQPSVWFYHHLHLTDEETETSPRGQWVVTNGHLIHLELNCLQGRGSRAPGLLWCRPALCAGSMQTLNWPKMPTPIQQSIPASPRTSSLHPQPVDFYCQGQKRYRGSRHNPTWLAFRQKRKRGKGLFLQRF